MWPRVQVLGVTGIKKVQVHLFLLKFFDHKESNSSKPKIRYNQNTWPNYQKGPIIQRPKAEINNYMAFLIQNTNASYFHS